MRISKMKEQVNSNSNLDYTCVKCRIKYRDIDDRYVEVRYLEYARLKRLEANVKGYIASLESYSKNLEKNALVDIELVIENLNRIIK